MRSLQWYKRGAAYNPLYLSAFQEVKGGANPSPLKTPVFIGISGEKVKGEG